MPQRSPLRGYLCDFDRNSYTSHLWESRSEPPKRCLSNFLFVCDMICGKTSLICLSLWTSWLCSELGDQAYQIQATWPAELQAYSFIHTCIQQIFIESVYASDSVHNNKLIFLTMPTSMSQCHTAQTQIAGDQESFPQRRCTYSYMHTMVISPPFPLPPPLPPPLLSPPPPNYPAETILPFINTITIRKDRHGYFFYFLFFIIMLLLYLGYIVTFAKVLRIYHSWIHSPLSFPFISPSTIPGLIS
jgi:hypothetical protein